MNEKGAQTQNNPPQMARRGLLNEDELQLESEVLP